MCPHKHWQRRQLSPLHKFLYRLPEWWEFYICYCHENILLFFYKSFFFLTSLDKARDLPSGCDVHNLYSPLGAAHPPSLLQVHQTSAWEPAIRCPFIRGLGAMWPAKGLPEE